MSIIYTILSVNQLDIFFSNVLFIYIRHFLPYRRADFTTKPSLWPARGSSLQFRRLLPHLCCDLDS
jgi:hypothetical protein